MLHKKIKNTNDIVDNFLSIYLKDMIVCDCTLGNGFDALKILNKMDGKGFLYGFDIQKQAILNTQRLLTENNRFNYKLYKASHENIDKYIDENLDLVIYNLGYLPGGDKNIVTKSDSTLKSISKALKLLNEEGVILISSYIGHDGGKKENKDLESWLSSLDQKKYSIIKHRFINQKNNPPILYIISKLSLF